MDEIYWLVNHNTHGWAMTNSIYAVRDYLDEGFVIVRKEEYDKYESVRDILKNSPAVKELGIGHD